MQSPGSGRDTLARELDGLRAALGEASSVLGRVQDSLASPSSGPPPVVSVRTVAKWLGMSERGVRKMIERGEIPAARLGRRLVVLLEPWMAKLQQDALRLAPVPVREDGR